MKEKIEKLVKSLEKLKSSLLSVSEQMKDLEHVDLEFKDKSLELQGASVKVRNWIENIKKEFKGESKV